MGPVTWTLHDLFGEAEAVARWETGSRVVTEVLNQSTNDVCERFARLAGAPCCPSPNRDLDGRGLGRAMSEELGRHQVYR